MKRILPFLLFVLSASVAFGGHAGIWKSTNPVCNFYIQTYQGNDSILIIVTPDARTEWYVFLDSNIYDDVNVSELTGKAAILAFYLQADGTALADLTVNGKSTVYSLARVQEGDCRSIGSGGEPPVPPGVDVSDFYHVPRPGDHYINNWTVTRSAYGNTDTLNYTLTSAYSSVNEIPSKYNYSGTLPGPYLRNIEQKDGSLDGYEYATTDGKEIIDDDLYTYTSLDDRVETGDDEPDVLVFGNEYQYSLTETLFSSTNGSSVGDRRITAAIIPQKFETVSVPAGTYTALKLIVNANYSETEYGEVLFGDSSMTAWYVKQIGIVKSYQGIKITSEGYTVTGTALQELATVNKSTSGAMSAAKLAPIKRSAFFAILLEQSFGLMKGSQ